MSLTCHLVASKMLLTCHLVASKMSHANVSVGGKFSVAIIGLYEYYVDNNSVNAAGIEFITQLLPCIIHLVTELDQTAVGIPDTIRTKECYCAASTDEIDGLYILLLPILL